MRKRWIALGLAGVITLGGGVAFVSFVNANDGDSTALAGLISRTLSSKDARVTIGAIEGALSSQARLRNLVVADKDGPWLKLDEASLSWSRLALLRGRLQVDELALGKIEILRKPAPVPPEAADVIDKQAAASGPLLPQLPVKAEIKSFVLKSLALSEGVLGVAAELGAEGSAQLGDPAEGLQARLNVQRKDAPGAFDLSASFQPQSTDLAIAAHFDEPEGGLVARFANLPGHPPVSLEVKGAGKLDAFKADLNFKAGATIGAAGVATLNRNGAARKLALDVVAKLEGLMPPAIGPVFAGETRLGGALSFADDRALAFDDLALQSQTARLEIKGGVDARQIADITINARALPLAKDDFKAAARIEKLVFDMRVSGPLAFPKIEGGLDLAHARMPAAEISSAKLNFSGLAEGEGPMTLQADGAVDGLLLADPKLRAAIGDKLALTLRGALGRDGVAAIDKFSVDGATFKAGYSGRIGASDVKGRLFLNAPDLRHFAALSGLDLQGKLDGGVDLSGDPSRNRVRAETRILATSLRTGLNGLDGALGGKLTLEGETFLAPGRAIVFRKTNLSGQNFKSELTGALSPVRLGVELNGELTDLKKIDARLAGRALLQGAVSGPIEAPEAKAALALKDASAMGKKISKLALNIEAKNLVAAPDARVTLDGDIGGKPAKGLIVAQQQGALVALKTLDLAIGALTAKGALSAQGKALDGEITIAAKDLSDISALALTPVAGDLDAHVGFSPKGGQSISLKAKSSALRFGDARLERLDADLSAADIYNKPALSGRLTLDKALAGGETIGPVKLDAQPQSAGGGLALSARARGIDLNLGGKLSVGAATTFLFDHLEARKGAKKIALAKPGSIVIGDGRVTLQKIALALDGGQLDLDGRVSPDLALNVVARNVPLSVAEFAQPGLGISGQLNAQATLSGAPQAPAGEWRVGLDKLSAPQLHANGLPAINLEASGKLGGGRTTLDAVATGQGLGAIKAQGAAPLGGAGALDLKITGKLDFGVANAKLGPSGQRVSGFGDVDARIAGAVSAPRVEGGLKLVNVSFSDAETGLKLSDLNGRIVGSDRALVLEGISGKARNGGTIGVAGRIGLDAAAGFPGMIKISAQGAELMSSQVATAVADVALELKGPLAKKPAIAGRVQFSQLDVAIPERLPGGARPIADAKHIKPPPQVAARLAAAAKAKKAAEKGGAFDATMDIAVLAPNRVFVRGRGVDAELAGELKVRGGLANPSVIGGFQMRRGRLNVAGKTMNFTKGVVTFSGSLTPELDFLATGQGGDATIQVALSGPASAPSFSFSSTPDLPQDEIFARLAFGKSSASLGAAQALQLAALAAQFSGGDGGDAFEKMRKQLGVSSLDMNVGSDGSVGVGATKSINDRISVGAKAGAKPQDTGVSVDVDITRRIRLQGEATAAGSASVGIGFETEY